MIARSRSYLALKVLQFWQSKVLLLLVQNLLENVGLPIFALMINGYKLNSFTWNCLLIFKSMFDKVKTFSLFTLIDIKFLNVIDYMFICHFAIV